MKDDPTGEITNGPAPTAFRVRMIFGKWHVQYFVGDVLTSASNPMNYAEAMDVAKASGLPDYERAARNG